MPRGPRQDAAGCVFHVMNRGGAKRTLFEAAKDFRYFLSRVAYAARRGEIEVLAFVLLMTHFHLLVRSLGHLSEALRRIQNEYVRYFNRARKRDGALMRGRFLSKPVRSPAYLSNCWYYLDENPVQAKLVARPEDWPWGSASRFASGRPGLWLSPWLRDRLNVSYGAEGNLAPEGVRRARAGLIEARLSGSTSMDDPLDDLLSGLPDRVWTWMVRKARLADGTAPGMAAAGPDQVLMAVGEHPAPSGDLWVKLEGTHRHSLPLVLSVGLLRDLAAVSYAEIGMRVGRSPSNAKHLHGLHCRAVLELEDYAAIARTITEAVVEPFR